MAGQVERVELWSTLQSASGTRLCADLRWMSLTETRREDGDDSLLLTFPLTLTAASQVGVDKVIRLVYEDATVAEYRIAVIEEIVHDDVVALTCTAARTILAGAEVANTLTFTAETPSSILTQIRTGSTSWPASVTSGTIQPTATLNLTVQQYTNGLAAVLQLVDAIDATLPDGDPPCVLRFRRASDSSWVMDILTTPATGTAHLLEGKNLPRLTRRVDKTTGTSVTSYQFEVADLYRTNRTVFSRDNLTPYETARFESATLGVDTSAVRISEVVTNHANTLDTRVQLGEPRRRLSREVEDIALAVVPASPVLTVTPGTVTSTTQPYTVSATVPSGTVRIQVTPRGTTATGSSYGPITDGLSITAVEGEVITVDRPAVGSYAGLLIVEAFTASGGAAAQTFTIEPQTPPILLTITATQTAADDTTVTYDVVGVDPSGIETVTVSDDGGSATTGPTGDSFVIARPTAGDPPLTVKFTATATGRVAQSVSIVVPAQDVGGGGTFPPSIDTLIDTAISTGSNYITLEWSASNEPASETYDLRWRWKTIDPSTGVVAFESQGTDNAVTTPYNWSDADLDIVNKFDSGWEYLEVTFTLKMKNSGATVVATKDAIVNSYGIYTP